MMSATTVEKPGKCAATWLGLFISLFGMLLVRQAFGMLTTEPGPALVLARECCMFLMAGTLLQLVREGEDLPLSSVGIGTSPVLKSLAWGAVIAVACLISAAVLSRVTGYGHGPSSQTFARLPPWVLMIVVVRAGAVEEFFYRGYAIERVQALGFGRWVSWLIPLVIFSLAHWTGGTAGMVIALVLGGILTAFYQWRRDLIANMFGHFLTDFVANVLPAFLG